MKKLLAGLLFLAVPVFGEDWIPQPIGPFGTLNDTDNSYAIPADKSQDLLNVDISPGGKSVKKRDGYGIAATLTITTSPVHGIYNFFDSNGNDVSLYFNDRYLTSSISGSSPSVIFSTQTNGATYQCTDSLGFAYCVNTARTSLIKTNGVSYSHINPPSTGTMVAVSPTRLIQAGFSDAPSRIDFSKEADFTTWTPGSAGSDPAQFTVNAPGAKITHIVYAFGRLIWFKDTSFGYILIGNQPAQSDWVIKTVSFDVGTNDNTSVYREGLLYFRGKDSDFYVFDGSSYKKISTDIAGTVGLTQTRALNSWTQTTQSDFAAGSVSTQTYLSTAAISGSIVLDTATAISAFVDTSSANWAAGTLTTVSTTVIDGSITLSRSVVQLDTYTTDDATDQRCDLVELQQAFVTSGSQTVTGVQLRLKRTGSPGTGTVYIRADNNNTPGSVIGSQSQSFNSVSTSYEWVNIPFTNEVSIGDDSRYWIGFGPFGDASNRVDWLACNGGGCSVSGQKRCSNGTSCATTITQLYKVDGAQYSTSGNVVSRIFDTGITTQTWKWEWSNFNVSSAIPTLTGITYETQTSSSSTGVFSTLTSIISGSTPTSTVQEFIRYKASFTTTNISTSPKIDDVTINMTSRRRPYGTFQSAVKNASSITAWDTFNATKQDNDGTHTFYIRSHPTAFPVTSSTISWTSLSNGAIPTVSTGTSGIFFQIRDDFNITNSTQNPKLDEFTQNWFEGNAADKAYATYFDDRIWWSVTNGEGATTNNKVLLYDLYTNGWTVYDLASNGFLTRNKSLYFGSSSAGYVYKFGEGNSDNGSAINAYWKSKDFFGADPFVQTELANISVVAKSVENSSTTITYAINGSSETSYTMNQYNTTGDFKISNKNLPGGKTGSSYSVKFGNNAADQPFEIFGIQVGIRKKPWIPQ